MDGFLEMVTKQEIMFDWCQNLDIRSRIYLGLV